MAKTLGATIKAIREAKNLLPAELARQASVDKSTLSDYEADESEPTFSKLKALALALEVRAGYFFGEIEELRSLTPAQVVSFESLRLFLLKRGTPDVGEHPYRRLLAVPEISPRTVAEWDLFYRRETLVRAPGDPTPS